MPAISLPSASASPTDPQPPFPVLLAPRQQRTTLVIPAHYGGLESSLHPGIIVGIVVGSVAAFLLLIFLFYSCLGFGPAVIPASELSVRPKHRRSRRHHHHHSRSRSRRRSGGPRVRATETVEVRTHERERQRTSGGAGGEPVIVEPPPPPPPRAPPSDEEESEDEVVVIEEEERPRHKTRRGERRRESGYRDIHPEQFAGGDEPFRHVRREGTRRSRDH